MASNKQIIEGLWGLGYTQAQLASIPTDGTPEEFKRSLFTTYGIKGADVDRAQGLADWRPPKGVSSFEGKLTDYLKNALKLPPEQVDAVFKKAIEYGKKTPELTSGNMPYGDQDILAGLKDVLGPQGFTQSLIKLNRGTDIQKYQSGMGPSDVPTWNPFRGDAPMPTAGPAPAPGTPTGAAGSTAQPAPTPGPVTPGAGSPGQPAAPGKGTGPAAPGGGAGAPPPADLTPKNDTDAIALLKKEYGKDAWVLDVPEVQRIVLDALKNPSGVSQGIIDSAIMKTTWWQQNGKNVADFIQAKNTDAVGLNTKIAGKANTVLSRASAAGIELPYDKAVSIATDWQKWGWDDTQLAGAISSEFHYQAGQHDLTTDSLQNVAHQYLTPISDGTIQAWGQKLIAGTDNIENFKEFMKNQARSMFPGAAPRLDAGETMQDIAKPYAALAGQYLEIDPNSVDFMDPKWMAALDQADPKTGVKTTMSPNEWIQKIRTDSTYGYNNTKQAKDAATGFAMDIMKKFGATA